MSAPKCSERATILICNAIEASIDEADSADETRDELKSYIATLEHRNAALERVVEAAMDVEPPCDYYVFSGHDREDEHREDCAACELKDALRALDGEGK